MFAAIFFVSVGHADRPARSSRSTGWRSLVLTVVVVVGKMIGVTLGAFLTGNGVRTRCRRG